MKLKMNALQKYNLFLVWNQTNPPQQNCGTRYSCNNKHMKNTPAHYIFKRGMGVVEYKKNPNIDGEMCTAKWEIFHGFVMFTSTLVYIFVWNQYIYIYIILHF